MHIYRFAGMFVKGGRASLGTNLNIEDEYTQAIRTNSYNEICNKLDQHHQIQPSSSLSITCSSIQHHQYHHVNLSEYLVEPDEQILADFIKSAKLQFLLLNYFDATLEACNVCELLLQCVHQTRVNYQILVELHCRVSDPDALISNLSSFASLQNLLSTVTPARFSTMHDRHSNLLSKLTIKYNKLQKRAKLAKRCKKFLGCALIVSYGALGIALIILLIHSLVGFIAAPGFIACCSGFLKKKKLGVMMRSSSSQQLDAAARGIYILINDFDTTSRLVMRLSDEIEHIKGIASICVRNGRADEVLKEVVREIKIHENGFLEQLKELEQHIYLCFLTINRSRRQVLQEIM